MSSDRELEEGAGKRAGETPVSALNMSTDRVPKPRVHEDARSSRERLVEAAAALFHEEGYHKVSLDKVLREAGVVRSNFYYHFRSKEELAIAVIDTWLDQLMFSVIGPALADEALTPVQRVGRILEGLVEELECGGCRGGCPFGSLANAEAEHNERFRQKLQDAFDGFARLLEGLFAESIAAGRLPRTLTASRLAACTLSVVQGGYLLTKTYASSTPMRQAAQGLIELLGATFDEKPV
jgi:TetR/AcrR family transcriptional repressor of nem operon